MTARDTTRDLRRRLSNRFGRRSDAVPMPEHVVLFEVPVDGARRLPPLPERGIGEYRQKVRRRIDAVAVGVWRSTGHLVHGFEIKATRADLRNELADPDKSEPGRRLCDRWWLVLADAKLLGDDAPPDGWGVLARHGRGLRELHPPAPLTPDHDPRFTAALVQTAVRGSGRLARGLGVLDGYRQGWDRALTIGIRREINDAYSRGMDEGYRLARGQGSA